MQNVVTANDSGVRVRKKRKGVTHFPRMPAIDLNRIDADRGDANSARLKLGQALLKTPQLGVAERSPMSAVKDQDRAVGRKQIGQRNRLSILIR